MSKTTTLSPPPHPLLDKNTIPVQKVDLWASFVVVFFVAEKWDNITPASTLTELNSPCELRYSRMFSRPQSKFQSISFRTCIKLLNGAIMAVKTGVCWQRRQLIWQLIAQFVQSSHTFSYFLNIQNSGHFSFFMHHHKGFMAARWFLLLFDFLGKRLSRITVFITVTISICCH